VNRGSSHLGLLQFSDVILSIAVMSQEESGREEYDDKGVENLHVVALQSSSQHCKFEKLTVATESARYFPHV